VPNTLLTPHTGGATINAVPAMLRLLMQNLAAHFAGQPVVTPAS
jgi:lactate dehydrogenase-like 2-hydroxyacid dehydrogenase